MDHLLLRLYAKQQADRPKWLGQARRQGVARGGIAPPKPRILPPFATPEKIVDRNLKSMLSFLAGHYSTIGGVATTN